MASDETARPNAASDGDVIPEAGRGVDLQPDVERLHRAIRREPHDPVEGREAAPWFFVASVAIAFLWGGWYMGRYGGEFNRSTHIALGRRDAGTGGAAASQVAATIADPVAAGAQLYTITIRANGPVAVAVNTRLRWRTVTMTVTSVAPGEGRDYLTLTASDNGRN